MKNLQYGSVLNIYLGIFSGVFLVLPKLSALGIILLIILVGIGHSQKQLKFKWHNSFYFPILLYLFYLVGILFTDHLDLAKSYAENKMALIVLPIVFAFQPKFKLDLSPILLISAFGSVVASLIGMVNSYECWMNSGDIITCIRSVNISPIHHPSYMATFMLFITVGCWWGYKEKWKRFHLKWLIPFTIFSTIIFILCMSLAAYVLLITLIIIVVLKWLYSVVRKAIFWFVLLTSPLILFAILSLVPVIKEEVSYTTKAVESFLNNPEEFVRSKKGYKTGNEVRLIMWTVTIMEIKSHPLGVGTGNVDEHLSERLAFNGQDKLAMQDDKGTIQFNPHNQYLQTSLEIGVLGGLLLLAMLFSWWRLGIRFHNPLLLLLSGSLFFNCFFESMLQRQSGIIFFCFWAVLLIIWSINKRSETTDLVSNQ